MQHVHEFKHSHQPPHFAHLLLPSLFLPWSSPEYKKGLFFPLAPAPAPYQHKFPTVRLFYDWLKWNLKTRGLGAFSLALVGVDRASSSDDLGSKLCTLGHSFGTYSTKGTQEQEVFNKLDAIFRCLVANPIKKSISVAYLERINL